MKVYLHILRHAGSTDDAGIINSALTHEEKHPFTMRDGHEIQTINLDPSLAFTAGWNAAANRSLDGLTDDEIAEARAVDEIVYLEK